MAIDCAINSDEAQQIVLLRKEIVDLKGKLVEAETKLEERK